MQRLDSQRVDLEKQTSGETKAKWADNVDSYVRCLGVKVDSVTTGGIWSAVLGSRGHRGL